MRKSCRECVIKHLSACLVQLNELPNYPRNEFFIIGNLNEAEEESRLKYPELAEMIRSARRNFASEKDLSENSLLELLAEAKKMEEGCDGCGGC